VTIAKNLSSKEQIISDRYILAVTFLRLFIVLILATSVCNVRS